MAGKRSTFIEVQPFAHEDPNRKPKYSLPFSPVKHSTYDIRSTYDGDDIISVNSDNLPDDTDSTPGSRPSSALRRYVTPAEAVDETPNTKARRISMQNKTSPLSTQTRKLRQSLRTHKVEGLHEDLESVKERLRQDLELGGHSVIAKIHSDSKDAFVFSAKQKEVS